MTDAGRGVRADPRKSPSVILNLETGAILIAARAPDHDPATGQPPQPPNTGTRPAAGRQA